MEIFWSGIFYRDESDESEYDDQENEEDQDC